jgi:hypothetical protein
MPCLNGHQLVLHPTGGARHFAEAAVRRLGHLRLQVAAPAWAISSLLVGLVVHQQSCKESMVRCQQWYDNND